MEYLQIINCYEANAPVEALLDAYRINLIHDAHGLGGKNVDLGRTPTRRIGKTIHDAFRLVRMKGANCIRKDCLGSSDSCAMVAKSKYGIFLTAAMIALISYPLIYIIVY